jgi:hypothetical protein
MRNLLAESKEISKSGYYLNADGTKSETPYYEIVIAKIELSDNIIRYYRICRNGFVGRKGLTYTPTHSISGTTYDRNADYSSRESGRKFMTYKDEESFVKAIKSIQKRLTEEA